MQGTAGHDPSDKRLNAPRPSRVSEPPWLRSCKIRRPCVRPHMPPVRGPDMLGDGVRGPGWRHHHGRSGRAFGRARPNPAPWHRQFRPPAITPQRVMSICAQNARASPLTQRTPLLGVFDLSGSRGDAWACGRPRCPRRHRACGCGGWGWPDAGHGWPGPAPRACRDGQETPCPSRRPR